MELSPTAINEWLNRFNMFNDGVIRSWKINLNSQISSFEFYVETRDLASPENEWVNLHVNIRECEEIAFNRSDTISFEVLSNGLHVIHENGIYGLEFGDFVDFPDSIEDLASSRCYVVGRRVEWNFAE